MALSDQLTALAARAKEAQDRAGAAQGKAKADIQAEVEAARASTQERAKKVVTTAADRNTRCHSLRIYFRARTSVILLQQAAATDADRRASRE